MNWMIWRQHRKQFLFAGAAVAAIAAALVILGAYTAHSYHHSLAVHDPLAFHYLGIARYLPLATIALPLLLGMFWGAPLIAKEYEEGTNKLVWTQSVTRRQWLNAKLGWTLGLAALYGAIFSLATGWALNTENTLWLDRFEWVHFDAQGLMPIVYAVFAVALGALIGAWSRRAVLALGVTLGVFAALQLAMGLYVRPAYMKPLQVMNTYYVSFPKGGGESTTLRHTQTGIEPANNTAFWNLGFIGGGNPDYCAPSAKVCYATDISGLKYQPANRYWPFQFIETGIYLLLTITAVGTTYWLMLRRDIS